MSEITTEDMLREVRRELQMRRRNYPRWVAAGSMKQEAADRQIAIMEVIADKLDLEHDAQQQAAAPDMFR